MRDLLVAAVVFGALPFILRRPHIGIYVFAWLGFMNPHRLSWGFAYDFPFAFIVALFTLGAYAISKEPKRMPMTRETKVLLLFLAWIAVTTLFAFYPELAQDQIIKVFKIQLMVFLTMILINTKERLIVLIWVVALSLTFYGVKGGIFTILNGGVYRVQGPFNTFIGGNNEMALALIMTVPLLWFLQLNVTQGWLRVALHAMLLLTGIAIIGSLSRGALVGGVVMAIFLWGNSRGKVLTGLMIAIAVLAIAAIMPEQWYERIATIRNYEQDRSALGRINAWWVAFNVASNRITGGGFETFQWGIFQIYAPNPNYVHDVHSIYFEVLGEHGFIGLGIFLLLAGLTWNKANRIQRAAKTDQQLHWMRDLALMIQVSAVGYAAAGMFLGLAYFDLYYNLIAMIVICELILRRQGIDVSRRWLVRSPRTAQRTPLEGTVGHGRTSA